MLRLVDVPGYAVNFSKYLESNLEIHFKLVTVSLFHFAGAARTLVAGRFAWRKRVGKPFRADSHPRPQIKDYTGLQPLCYEYSQVHLSLHSNFEGTRELYSQRDLIPNLLRKNVCLPNEDVRLMSLC